MVKKRNNYIILEKSIVLFLGDTIKIKVSDVSLPLSVRHADEFGKYFPDNDQSPSERSTEVNTNVWSYHSVIAFYCI